MAIDPTLLQLSVDAVTPGTQVAIVHDAYGSGGNRVSAGTKVGWARTVTSTSIEVRSAPGGGGSIVATVPKSAIQEIAGGAGWRNLG